MSHRGTLFRILFVLALIGLVLVLAACGQEEGREAREMVDEAGRQATDFAEGFCAAIVLAPLCLGIALARREKGS